MKLKAFIFIAWISNYFFKLFDPHTKSLHIIVLFSAVVVVVFSSFFYVSFVLARKFDNLFGSNFRTCVNFDMCCIPELQKLHGYLEHYRAGCYAADI